MNKVILFKLWWKSCCKIIESNEFLGTVLFIKHLSMILDKNLFRCNSLHVQFSIITQLLLASWFLRSIWQDSNRFLLESLQPSNHNEFYTIVSQTDGLVLLLIVIGALKSLIKELSFCYKLKYSYPYIFATMEGVNFWCFKLRLLIDLAEYLRSTKLVKNLIFWSNT